MATKSNLRRTKLHQAVFEEICDCPKCPPEIDRRMSFWKNIQTKAKFQFEFSVCRICGYTIILERYIGDSKAEIDVSRPDIIGHLHDVTRISRIVALGYKDKKLLKEAVAMSNIRFISIADEGTLINAFHDRLQREKDERRRVAEEKRLKEEMENGTQKFTNRSNGANLTLAVNRAKKKERDEEKNKKKEFKCTSACGKSFPTKQKLNNHKCNPFDELNYVERRAFQQKQEKRRAEEFAKRKAEEEAKKAEEVEENAGTD